MGYVKHHTIVVSSFLQDKIIEIREMAVQIFSEYFEDKKNEIEQGTVLISNIMSGVVNRQYSFFIAPDGSKEGWDDSDKGDSARENFLDWLSKSELRCDYVEIMFGGDDEHQAIIRSKNTDMNEIEDF